VVAVLDRLAVPFCAASNGRPEKVALTLGASGLAGYFAGRVFTTADVPRGKPAPDLFLLAASRMGARPDRCVVVEDCESGVTAARAAGMRVLQYTPVGSSVLNGVDRAFAMHDGAAVVARRGGRLTTAATARRRPGNGAESQRRPR
jgi:beta-phosphoglucomutase-like phosphatase (HAD superfamily)